MIPRARRRPRRTITTAATALAAALVVAGCGSSSDPGPTMETGPVTVLGTDGSTRVAPAQTDTTTVRPPTPAPPRTAAQRLAVVIHARLLAADVDAELDQVTGGAGGVTADEVSIRVYASEAESRSFYRSLRQTIRVVDGAALGRRVGTRNYYYVKDDDLSAARNREIFERVVRVAEGR